MANEENIEKMKNKKYTLSKLHKDYNILMLSFYTRYTTMEFCFGNPDNEEPNIAYSIL
jgi:hypothetical protein